MIDDIVNNIIEPFFETGRLGNVKNVTSLNSRPASPPPAPQPKRKEVVISNPGFSVPKYSERDNGYAIAIFVALQIIRSISGCTVTAKEIVEVCGGIEWLESQLEPDNEVDADTIEWLRSSVFIDDGVG